ADVANRCQSAVVVLGRSAGEDSENSDAPGVYRLTDEERDLLLRVGETFEKVCVVLNVCSLPDLAWEKDLLRGKAALLIAWQGGMESGNALADVLLGDSEPSGRLPDTAAVSYAVCPTAEHFGAKDYNEYTEDVYVGYRYFETFAKDDVLFPFGAGFGYTTFTREVKSFSATEKQVEVAVTVTNTGDRAGKEVLQLYCEAPCGKLGKPARVLCAFRKTGRLAPGESEDVVLTAAAETYASYDDAGKTGRRSAWLLERGVYRYYLGGDVRDAVKAGEFALDSTCVVKLLKEVAAPAAPFKRLVNNEVQKEYELTPPKTENLRDKILSALPPTLPAAGDKGLTLGDVAAEKATLQEFVAQLSTDELEAISRGDYTMNSPLGAAGNAGAFGGVLPSLREKGVEPIVTTDGPSGIRLAAYCSLLPIGQLLASTWNPELVERLYALVGKELVKKGSDVLLGPGMNIHRDPLCGRNFEYFSEDPLLCGKTAAAFVRGVQSAGKAACPKHFACNNQETNRSKTDSRVSERALREIYLKGFEICVKEAKPLCLMTSYNKVNGVWSHYHYDLVERILRGEWGFDGVVMTDWWMQSSKSPEFPSLCDNAYRVRAGVDVLMPGGARTGKRKPDGTLLKTLGKPGGITRGELQRTAERVCKLVLRLKY
ncbi:MAG: glycoside hydrolase family 3 C-terminal domain-containing protein, partial [Clostridia bacterium]|nr:glycoside hydrolase family 3 C-terminal domain-containing protein [Clostridia bacterium]